LIFDGLNAGFKVANVALEGYENKATIENAAKTVGNGVETAASKVASAAKTAGSAIKHFFSSWKRQEEAAELIFDGLNAGFHVADGALEAYENKGTIENVGTTIANDAKTAGNAIKNFFSSWKREDEHTKLIHSKHHESHDPHAVPHTDNHVAHATKRQAELSPIIGAPGAALGYEVDESEDAIKTAGGDVESAAESFLQGLKRDETDALELLLRRDDVAAILARYVAEEQLD